MPKTNQKKKTNRIIYKVDPKKFLRYAGRIANANLPQGHGNAVQMVKDCMYIQEGIMRRELTSVDAAEQLKKLK